MKQVEFYARVMYAVLIEGISERAAVERFGINARTVSKMLRFSVPPGYVRTKPPFRPQLDAFVGIIDAILAANKERPKKQRHTAKCIFERLRDRERSPLMSARPWPLQGHHRVLRRLLLARVLYSANRSAERSPRAMADSTAQPGSDL